MGIWNILTKIISTLIPAINANVPANNNIKKDNYMNKLIKTNNNYSVTGFFLIITIIVGALLLIVPIVALTIEVWYNHTISTNLNGMASYITAVAGIFGSGGFTYALTKWSDNKYNNNTTSDNTTNNNTGVDNTSVDNTSVDNAQQING